LTSSPPPRRRWFLGILVVYTLALAASVLAPQPIPLGVESLTERVRPAGFPGGWLADVLRNLLLFVPLGVGLVGFGASKRQAIAAGLGVSFAIELVQLAIPGRFGSPVDVLSNTLGAAGGANLMTRWKDWLVPEARRARRLSLLGSFLGTGLLLLSSLMLQPLFPESTYFGGWTPSLGHLAQYHGRVLDASIGGVAIVPAGPSPDSRTLRAALVAGAPWVVRAVAGRPPPALAPVVAIHDDRRREILLVGVDELDLAIRMRTLASVVGLENPTLRLPGALADVRAGGEWRIRVAEVGSDVRVALGEAAPRSVAWPVGRAWGLLLHHDSIPETLTRILDGLWVAALFFPVAFWARNVRIAWAGVAGLAAAMLLLPCVGPMGSGSLVEWLAATGAIALGHGCWRRIP